MHRVLLVIAFGLFAAAPTFAFEVEFATSYPPPGEYMAHEDVRSGGVLEKTAIYDHTPYQPIPSPQPNIMPANGAYGWGFPVTTYRWGWFGAEHYWPRVTWFKGYYGDCCRAGYRQGY